MGEAGEESMNYNEFRSRVIAMRAAQKQYERARVVSCGETLQTADDAKCEAEEEVDSLLAEYDANKKRVEAWKAVHG